MAEILKTINIKNGINVHYIEDEKFKTTTLGVYIHTPLCKENASRNALLPMVLKRGSQKYPTFSDIEKKLGDLCGASISADVIKRGEDQILCFNLSTISDKYYLGEENILSSCAELMFDIILNPKNENGGFLREYVEGEKQNLTDAIEALVNDKQSYALWRVYEVMCQNEAYGVYDYGSVEDVAKIEPCELYEYYKKLLKESRIDIFVCGLADITSFAEDVKKAFLSIDKEDCAYPESEKIYKVESVKNAEDIFDTNQAKLSLGMRITKDTDYASMLVANSIWGSGPHSKLFNNVREKLSLAYYAFSRFDKYKNTILVGMGIETKNYQKALDETLLQLKCVQEGGFSDAEFGAAKAFLINSFMSRQDNQYAMIDFHLGQCISGESSSIEDICQKINEVSRQNAIEASKSIELDTIYFLKGKADGE